MMGTRLFVAILCGSVIAACGTLQDRPGSEVRQALAPSGKLRVALFEGNAVHVIKDPASGEMRGVGHDLGKAFATRLGVPFEPMFFPAFGPMLDAGKAGAWDVAFVGVNPERREFLDFTANHVEVDFGYLVASGSRLSTVDDVDRPGVRIAVVARGTPDLYLTRTLKSAVLVRAAGLAPALELVSSGKADVLAALKPAVHGVSPRLPGSRVLDGRLGKEEAAMATPKGRGPQATAYARSFIEDARSDGSVNAAIVRAGLRGVVVAPRE